MDATARQPSMRTPGIVYSALVFALLGFACGLPAVVGLILGLVGKKRAEAEGAGVGLATAAIVVSAIWLVGYAVLIAVAAISQRNAT